MDHLEKLSGNSIYRLAEASRLMRELCNKRLADLGVRPAQVNALAVLCDQKLSMPSEVARRLGVSRPSVTNLLERMERDDLIQRVKDRGNLRRVWIVPTPKGRELLQLAQRIYTEIGEDIAGLLGGNIGLFEKALSTVSDYAAGKPVEALPEEPQPSQDQQKLAEVSSGANEVHKERVHMKNESFEDHVAEKLAARMDHQ